MATGDTPTEGFFGEMNLNWMIEKSELADLYDKVREGRRLDIQDAHRLYQTQDLNMLGALADLANNQKNKNKQWKIKQRLLRRKSGHRL